MQRIVVLAIAFRVLSAAIAFAANLAIPDYQNQRFTMWGVPSAFWDGFIRYDGGWYLGIARSGYAYVAGGRSNIAFLPVYPLLMRYAGRLLGGSTAAFYLGGIAVSWTAFVAAEVILYRLARLDLRPREADTAVLAAAVFPFAFFFGVVYSESVFLLFTLLSFYGFRTRRWLWGGACGAVATATRVNGILMLPALAWIAWREAQADRRDRVLAAVGLVLVCCGIGAYSLFVYRLTSTPAGSHNPLEWVATIERWGYYPGHAPWPPLVRLCANLLTQPHAFFATQPMAPYDVLNGATALIFALAIPFVWMRLGAAYGWFMLANLWLPLSSGQYEGLGRYCAVLFPFFIWLGTVRSRVIVRVALITSIVLYVICLALFVNVYPIF